MTLRSSNQVTFFDSQISVQSLLCFFQIHELIPDEVIEKQESSLSKDEYRCDTIFFTLLRK